MHDSYNTQIDPIEGIATQDCNLLLISIGPVQDFIAAARKCQDLWFGSYLLSELSRAVAQTLPEDSVVFPGSLEDEGSVANKILARLPAGMDPQITSGKAEEAMRHRLSEMAKKAWPEQDDYFLEDVAREQLEELMEFFWVSVPERGDYGSARHRAEVLLASRKTTKTWAGQVSSTQAPSGSKKSTLDGSRESVIEEEAYRRLSPKDLYRRYGSKPKERLCGIAMIKRRGAMQGNSSEKKPRFHSTSHMAASPLLVRLARDPSAQECCRQYLDLLDGVPELDLGEHAIECGTLTHAKAISPPSFLADLAEVPAVPRTFDQSDRSGFDGILFFENRLQPDVFPQMDPRKRSKEVNHGRSRDLIKAQAFLRDRLLRGSGISTPCPYYAMLIADGDRMGKLIDDIGQGSGGIERHRKLSKQLDDFARRVRNTVEDHGGSLIYSGGDDVMALLPLHTALACSDKLRRSFTELIQVEGQKGPATLSAGLAFVHHLLPMDKARNLARIAEHNAKDKAGRNALGIVLDKRSGVHLSIQGKWDQDPCARLERWMQLLHEGRMPHGVAYELESMLAPFEVPASDPAGSSIDPSEYGPVIESLANRIIGRKRTRDGDAGIDDEVAAALRHAFSGLEDPLIAVAHLSAEIQVARLLLEANEIAWGRIQGGQDD